MNMIEYFGSKRNRGTQCKQTPKSKQQRTRSESSNSFIVIKKQNKELEPQQKYG